MTLKPVLKKIVFDIMDKVSDVQAIYLFGSAAKEEMHQYSDIDLAILCGKPMESVELWRLAQNLAGTSGRDIDLIDLNKASTVMRMQVISQGRRLVCHDFTVCERFEDLVFSDYARLNEEREGILESIQRQGAIYG